MEKIKSKLGVTLGTGDRAQFLRLARACTEDLWPRNRYLWVVCYNLNRSLTVGKCASGCKYLLIFVELQLYFGLTTRANESPAG